MAEILVLGTSDWNQPIATNQHYAVRELSKAHGVTFVESMGLRRPQLRARDLRRIISRIRRTRRLTTTRQVPSNVRIVSALVVPFHRGPARLLNRVLLRYQVRHWSQRSEARLLWCYSPVTYGLEKIATRTIYHCVDLLGEVPGIDQTVVRRGERLLAAHSAVAAGSSPQVVQHLRTVGFRTVHDWPNVADVEVFDARGRNTVRHPSAVFAGNLTPTKVDFDLIESLLKAGVTVHLAGPIAEGGGTAEEQVSRCVQLGAVFHGHLSPAELAALFSECTVGLIPYADNKYTQGVSPLKTFEYLAAGLAVVSTGVPSVVPVPGSVFVERRENFAGRVYSTTELGIPGSALVEHRADLASRSGWDSRGGAMRTLVTALLNRAPEGQQ